uniref:Putative secreted protein n=1 Tax=Ixodes ricinus TaxID=34613 RepID=A0A6B0U6A4_IXORI
MNCSEVSTYFSCSWCVLAGSLASLRALLTSRWCSAVQPEPRNRHCDFGCLASLQRTHVLRGKHSSRAGCCDASVGCNSTENITWRVLM